MRGSSAIGQRSSSGKTLAGTLWRRGIFRRRLNRFAALVDVEGRPCYVHVPHSGRLGELLQDGREVLVRPSRPALATSHRLWGVRLDTGWVVVDSAQANAAVHAALLHGGLRWPGLPGPWRREVALGGVRIDFASESDAGAAAWLETKCVTLVEAGVALFPDAPSRRAERQLQALVEERRRGARVIWLFLVQRSDATAFAVHAGHDPRFASAVEAARAAGVEFLAYGCRVRPGSMAVTGPLPFVDEKSVTSRTSTRSSEST